MNLGKFGICRMAEIYLNQNSEPFELPKMTFSDHLNSPKFDFT